MIEVVLTLIVLHTVDGHEVTVNRDLITSLTAHRDSKPNTLYVDTVQCIVGLNDGKTVPAAESCDAIRKMLEESK